MPRRGVLTAAERSSLFALPESQSEFARIFTFGESDLTRIRRRRGDANRLGFAVQMALLRFPGNGLATDGRAPTRLIELAARQLEIDSRVWPTYAARVETRREHLIELRSYLGLRQFGLPEFRETVASLIEIALRSDKGILLVQHAIERLRREHIVVPAVAVLERACAEAITRADRQIFRTLTRSLSTQQLEILSALLTVKPETNITWLTWLRQSPLKPNSVQMLTHIARLTLLQAVDLPPGIEQSVHQNRLLKIARDGAQMTPADLEKFANDRRFATLVAMVIEATATVTDQIVDLHDRILGKLFNAARNRHQQQFHKSGKEINAKIRLFSKVGLALLVAREAGEDPYTAIESVVPWDTFVESVADAGRLAQPDSFDYIHLIGENYATIRRYAPELLSVLKLRAAPAARGVLDALDILRAMNDDGARKLPPDAPTDFIKRRWKSVVVEEGTVDRRFYELCALSELRNGLRSGDIWVQGARQFKAFGEYLVSDEAYSELRDGDSLELAIATDRDTYLKVRLALLEEQLATVNRLAMADALPDAIVNESGMKITPLETSVPDSAQALIDRTAMMLPHIKITELLVEVDEWTGFTRHFTHLKTGEAVKDPTALLTVILADGINLGLTKMAESCPGTSYAKLAWLQGWHVRDETYSAALAELVNAQSRQPFAGYWGDGTTSSSDGQRFRAGGKAESTGHINPKYGSEPGRLFYTHVSDQYAPFSVKLVNVGIRDSTYVLDGLLYHESDLRIEEHYTDTAGFTDHVFALMHLLGFRFAPRIRDLKDTKLFVPEKRHSHSALTALIGGAINIRQIRTQWDEILRLATSIRQGTVTASLILRKLASYPRQNGLAVALREFGRIERTLFILDWLQSVEIRRRVNAGLNKGEARNALARAVFINRLGEIRDHSYEQQRFRASGLTLVTAAIALWNTVYLERAVAALAASGHEIDEQLLPYLSPLGWGHINLTGDYVWKRSRKAAKGRFRPLRPFRTP